MTNIKIYEKEISPVVTTAETLKIEKAEDMVQATELLSTMNKFKDKITEEKEKVTKPLNEALKAERARWKPIESLYETGIALVRAKMSTFQTAEARRRKEEADKIAKRIGEGRGKLTLDTAARKMEEIKTAPSKVESDAGKISFRTDKKLKVVDENKIPKAYWILDERKALADLKSGKKVPGCEVEEIEVPVNFR